ncbi:hypothetical protein Elgi_54870 [Paenibacillus elgii]|uniref:glycosyltransferase family 2 protein n=1 Tax=Paenibacillus elgii TaxID=189691 RepID=UPI002D7A9738|nr:hypothetical protein Elgi_54870 [Paenibacillus elgii]
MHKVYIRTPAYNAQETLHRAVDSILNQTYTNFSYYLCENGSIDSGATRRIVEEYASLDSRIVPFFNKVNRVWHGNEEYLDLPHHVGDDDYYCELDADDEYLPTFIEEMLAFMDEYNLDIACCGSDFYSVANNNRLVGRRLLHSNLILEGREFADFFPNYHVFTRTSWGKLFKGRTLRNYITRHEEFQNYPVAYGGDTFVTLRAFRDAKRVGILARPLHKYYISPNSVSHTIHPQRVKCDQILHEDAIDYLGRFGGISPENQDFLYAVYLNALKDTLTVLLNATLPITEKLNGLIEMFTYKYTRQLGAWEQFGTYIGHPQLLHSRREFFLSIANWLLTLEEVPDEQVEGFCDVGEFVCASAEYADGWIVFQKLRVRFLINQRRADEACVKLCELEELLPLDVEVLEFREQLNQSTDGHLDKDGDVILA